MRTDLVVVFHVRQQYVTEMPLAEHNNMVKALPSDRTDESLSKSPVPIADQIAGSLFPAACFRELICQPFCGRMRCDAKPKNLPPAMPHDQQAVEQTKRDCRDDEQIHRRDAVGMIIEKYFPTLGRRASTPGHNAG